MSTSVSLVLHLELKYCERCGALCLREKGEAQVLCDRCAESEANPPRPSGVRRPRRLA